MEKDFFDVFPNLKIKDELHELLDMVFVTRVACNPAKTRLWVTIRSERWIHKKYIFELERQIERQCFPGIQIQVTVIEKFRLSRQYTPDNFLEVYRSSMELELRNYNMLEYNLFKRAKISFTDTDHMELVLPDSVIAREKSGILVEYLHKVFCERCGMNLKIDLQFAETGESKYRRNAAIQIRQEVENVLKHAKLDEAGAEKAKEEKPEKTGEKKIQKKNRNRKPEAGKTSTATTGEDSAGIPIRMWFTAEILREIRSLWNPLQAKWEK